MSKAFDYVMDKAEELTEDCQRKTEEIQELNTFCMDPNDKITYFSAPKNEIVSFNINDRQDEIKEKLENSIASMFKANLTGRNSKNVFSIDPDNTLM